MWCWPRRRPAVPVLRAGRAVCSHFLAKGRVPTVTEDAQLCNDYIAKTSVSRALKFNFSFHSRLKHLLWRCYDSQLLK